MARRGACRGPCPGAGRSAAARRLAIRSTARPVRWRPGWPAEERTALGGVSRPDRSRPGAWPARRAGVRARGDGDAEPIGEDDLDERGRSREEPTRLRWRGADDGEEERGAVGGGLPGRARRSRAAAGLVEVIAEGG